MSIYAISADLTEAPTGNVGANSIQVIEFLANLFNLGRNAECRWKIKKCCQVIEKRAILLLECRKCAPPFIRGHGWANLTETEFDLVAKGIFRRLKNAGIGYAR